jgi:hypothetical protein
MRMQPVDGLNLLRNPLALPVGRIRRRINPDDPDSCPSCLSRNETCDRVVRCRYSPVAPISIPTAHHYPRPFHYRSLEAWISQAEPTILRCISGANDDYVQANTIDDYFPRHRDG